MLTVPVSTVPVQTVLSTPAQSFLRSLLFLSGIHVKTISRSQSNSLTSRCGLADGASGSDGTIHKCRLTPSEAPLAASSLSRRRSCRTFTKTARKQMVRSGSNWRPFTTHLQEVGSTHTRGPSCPRSRRPAPSRYTPTSQGQPTNRNTGESRQPQGTVPP